MEPAGSRTPASEASQTARSYRRSRSPSLSRWSSVDRQASRPTSRWILPRRSGVTETSPMGVNPVGPIGRQADEAPRVLRPRPAEDAGPVRVLLLSNSNEVASYCSGDGLAREPPSSTCTLWFFSSVETSRPRGVPHYPAAATRPNLVRQGTATAPPMLAEQRSLATLTRPEDLPSHAGVRGPLRQEQHPRFARTRGADRSQDVPVCTCGAGAGAIG